MKNEREKRELRRLRIVLISLVLAVRIVAYPMVIRSLIIRERMHSRIEMQYMDPLSLHVHLLQDAAILAVDALENMPLYFYDVRKTARRICVHIRQIPQGLFPWNARRDEEPPVWEEPLVKETG